MRAESESFSTTDLPPEGRTVQLHREELQVQKELRHAGDVEIRTEVEQVPGRVEVDALNEEVHVDHVPIGRVVSERQAPWHDGDTLVVPVYEEQLVVTKRLMLKEELHIRRVSTVERHVFEETLQRERVVIEEPGQPGMVRERYPAEHESEGLLDKLKKVLP